MEQHTLTEVLQVDSAERGEAHCLHCPPSDRALIARAEKKPERLRYMAVMRKADYLGTMCTLW